ncbi:Ig-like domain-containing protein [Pseudomonas viridiflava]|uniref:Ig-like domain-containing protein n=1 Tax=Pseudomonas viridiflava TaxID=33069 RepID=UPI000F067323|nr:Ig-like domain-containing protein [Pseudomonas viridiflava]
MPYDLKTDQALSARNDENLIAPSVAIKINNEGLLPVSALNGPIEVTFPAWLNVMEGISYQLLWDDKLTGEVKLIEKGTQPGTILNANIPVDALTEGKHTIAYRLTNIENGTTSDSPSSPVEVDITQPGAPTLAPIILPRQTLNGLTSEELENMGDVLTGTIAGYNGMQEGDVVRTYWNDVPGPMAVVTKDDMGLKCVMVYFVRPFLELIGDIEAPVYYTVTDLAGNQSMASETLDVKLQLTVTTPLPTPTIKEATGSTLDPINASAGATVVIEATANLKTGDQVIVQWQGPKGSDTKEKTLTSAEPGQALEVLFAAVLVTANAGQTVSVSYVVNRTNGLVQVSDTLALQVVSGLAELPAPRMDTVGADGVVTPSLIPGYGATVRVSYPGVGAQDSVVVNWRGASSHDTAAQVAGGGELQFNVPKALISATAGRSATVTYTVTRAGEPTVSTALQLSVRQELVLDTSPVTLAGKIYLLPGSPDLLPNFPADTTVQRQASGGHAPYRYASSNPLVVSVDGNGLASVRGKGTATITATDALGATKSYPVTVTGVIHCIGVGSGSFSQISKASANNGARIPTIHELVEIYALYGNRWPMGNGNYWSSTVSSAGIGGWNWYYVKNMVSGGNFKLKSHNSSLGVCIK